MDHVPLAPSDHKRHAGLRGERVQDVTTKAKEVASAIASGIREVAADAAHGAGRILNEGARGLFGGFATPLLIGGGAVAAFLLLRDRGERREAS